MWPRENLSFRFLAVGSLTKGQTQSLHSESRSLHAERMLPAGCSLSALNVVETLSQVSSYQMRGSFDMQLWLKNFPSTCLIPSWIVLQSETLPSQTSSSSPSFTGVRTASPSETLIASSGFLHFSFSSVSPTTSLAQLISFLMLFLKVPRLTL